MYTTITLDDMEKSLANVGHSVTSALKLRVYLASKRAPDAVHEYSMAYLCVLSRREYIDTLTQNMGLPIQGVVVKGSVEDPAIMLDNAFDARVWNYRYKFDDHVKEFFILRMYPSGLEVKTAERYFVNVLYLMRQSTTEAIPEDTVYRLGYEYDNQCTLHQEFVSLLPDGVGNKNRFDLAFKITNYRSIQIHRKVISRCSSMHEIVAYGLLTDTPKIATVVTST